MSPAAERGLWLAAVLVLCFGAVAAVRALASLRIRAARRGLGY